LHQNVGDDIKTNYVNVILIYKQLGEFSVTSKCQVCNWWDPCV